MQNETHILNLVKRLTRKKPLNLKLMILIELEYQNRKIFLQMFWLNIVGTIYEK